MSPSILISYATHYGSTKEVAELMSQTLSDAGLDVEIIPAHLVKNIDQYKFIILGAPLMMYHWHKDAMRFISRYKNTLINKKLAIFALGPVHVPQDEKEWGDSRNQLDKALANFPWLKPIAIEIFGGIYDPSKLGFPLKIFAGAEPASDALDKTAVIEWATSLAAKFGSTLS